MASSVGDSIVGNTISQDLRGVSIDILLEHGHCVQFGDPMRTHCIFR